MTGEAKEKEANVFVLRNEEIEDIKVGMKLSEKGRFSVKEV